MSITNSPCGDPTCYRGGEGSWNYQFKDGPCQSPNCKWPKDLKPRPHFTDTPASPIVDAGKIARIDYTEYKIAMGIPTREEMLADLDNRPYTIWKRPTFKEWLELIGNKQSARS